jgi:uncharacterized membrane protein YfcA
VTITHTLLLAVIFLAVFTQSLAGFGVALIAMALLPDLIGIQRATPLVALVAVTLEFFLLLRYRSALNLNAIWRVALASIVGIPLGLLALKSVSDRIVLAVLGVVIAGYALYALLDLHLPSLEHSSWAYGFGLLAGMLGGAYNTSGPPVIIYGNCRRWHPAEFKSNLQGFFLLNSIMIVIGHIINQTLTPVVWGDFLWALPAMGLGIVAGVSLDRYLDPIRFRKIVLWLLVFMGLRLIF